MRRRLLSFALLPLMVTPAALLKVGLVAMAVCTCAGGDRLLTLHQRHASRAARIPDARCCSHAQSTQPRLAAKRASTICTQPISAMNMGNGIVAAAPLCANRSVPTNT